MKSNPKKLSSILKKYIPGIRHNTIIDIIKKEHIFVIEDILSLNLLLIISYQNKTTNDDDTDIQVKET
jgi:hypothetical protein